MSLRSFHVLRIGDLDEILNGCICVKTDDSEFYGAGQKSVTFRLIFFCLLIFTGNEKSFCSNSIDKNRRNLRAWKN